MMYHPSHGWGHRFDPYIAHHLGPCNHSFVVLPMTGPIRYISANDSGTRRAWACEIRAPGSPFTPYLSKGEGR